MKYDLYPESMLAHYLWVVVSPVLLVVGTLGNVLSFLVLNQRHRVRTSTTAYLSALALCDLSVLCVGLLRHWLGESFEYDVRNTNDAMCKTHFYLVKFTLQFSSWILVAITIERVISVWKPHIAKAECTRSFAYVVLAVEAVVLMVLNGHILFGVKIRIVKESVNGTATNGSVCSCEPDPEDEAYSMFMYRIWTVVDFTIVFLFPFLILMASNIFIVVNIKRSRRFRRDVISGQMTTSRAVHTVQKPLIPLTAMLLTLNSVFFVCVGPANVYSIGKFHWWPYNADGHTSAVQRLLWTVVHILMYTNNAINFILYILCGSEFRAEVKRLLLQCCGIRWQQDPHAPARNSARLVINTSIEISSV